MSNSTNCWNAGSSDGPYNAFFAERKQVFKRTSASSYNQDITKLVKVCNFNHFTDCLGSTFSLNDSRKNNNVHSGISSFCNIKDIPNGGSCRTGNNTYCAWKKRQGLFTAFVKQAFCCKLSFPLFQHLKNVTGSRNFHSIYYYLVISLRGINRKTSGTADFVAIFRAEVQLHCSTTENYSLYLGIIVFKGKIDVTGRTWSPVRNFAFNCDCAEGGL